MFDKTYITQMAEANVLGYYTFSTDNELAEDLNIDGFCEDFCPKATDEEKREILSICVGVLEKKADPHIGPWTICVDCEISYEFTEDWTFEEACYRADCAYQHVGKVTVLNGNGFCCYEIK